MSAQKRPNWLLASLRNALMSQAVGLLFSFAGGAGIVAAALSYMQGFPLAQIFTYGMVAAAAGAALVGYGRRLMVDTNLRHKFYAFDLHLMHNMDEHNQVIGYTPFIELRNASDTPIHYKIVSSSGDVNRIALPDVGETTKATGTIQAGQDWTHALGTAYLLPPTTNTLHGSIKTRIFFGRNKSLPYETENKFEYQVLLDGAGNAVVTHAFHR